MLDLICISFFFFVPSVYVVWILLLPCYDVLDCFSNWEYFGAKQISQVNMRHFSFEGYSLKKNVCGEAKVIVKIDVYFPLFLNLIIEILPRSTPQIFCCCYHRQSCKKFCCHLQNILHLSTLSRN